MARKRTRVDFEPLRDEAKVFLSWATGIDFTLTDMSDPEYWLCCTVYDGAVPVVVIVFEFKTSFDPQATVAVADPRGLSRQLLTHVFRGVFNRAARISCEIDPDNKVALKQIWRMGFRPEGYRRRGYDGSRDAALWGLLPEECPYLRGEPFRYRWVQPTHETTQRMQ